ncbi:MAG: hypothetical protein IKP87_14715 [Victivallales bacterium]|nr:hypothetical protein [Victivallales bacterium]
MRPACAMGVATTSPPSGVEAASRRRVITTASRRRINRAKHDTFITACKRTS